MNQRSRGADHGEGGRRPLLIGGITPFSTVDWPGRLACVAFLAGCPWRCSYCQNHLLRSFDAATQTDEDLLAFLERRRGLLDGVVLSGGEPLAQAVSVDVAARVHEMGFDVGLHTCGGYPERLGQILPHVDWVGLDIKAPWDAYERVTRVQTGEPVRRSLQLVLDAGVAMEARTTWHPALLSRPTSPPSRTISPRAACARGPCRRTVTSAPRGAAQQTVYPSDVPEGLAELFETFEFRRA